MKIEESVWMQVKEFEDKAILMYNNGKINDALANMDKAIQLFELRMNYPAVELIRRREEMTPVSLRDFSRVIDALKRALEIDKENEDILLQITRLIALSTIMTMYYTDYTNALNLLDLADALTKECESDTIRSKYGDKPDFEVRLKHRRSEIQELKKYIKDV